jgi:hypothetical protein
VHWDLNLRHGETVCSVGETPEKDESGRVKYWRYDQKDLPPIVDKLSGGGFGAFSIMALNSNPPMSLRYLIKD